MERRLRRKNTVNVTAVPPLPCRPTSAAGTAASPPPWSRGRRSLGRVRRSGGAGRWRCGARCGWSRSRAGSAGGGTSKVISEKVSKSHLALAALLLLVEEVEERSHLAGRAEPGAVVGKEPGGAADGAGRRLALALKEAERLGVPGSSSARADRGVRLQQLCKYTRSNLVNMLSSYSSSK